VAQLGRKHDLALARNLRSHQRKIASYLSPILSAAPAAPLTPPPLTQPPTPVGHRMVGGRGRLRDSSANPMGKRRGGGLAVHG
jgi:hypothetical protein